MIAPRNYLPLLEDQHGEVRAIETDWLLATLERAAVKAGFTEWCLASDVISSVCSYLGGFYASNVVGLGRLQAAVRQVLRDVGYVEIARHFEAESPATFVSLLECAECVAPFELESFLQALSARIGTLHDSKLTSFHFYNLDRCLLYINNGEKCHRPLSRDDIVVAIRDRISALDWHREVVCSIS